jgi:uncharacterized membrane protein
MRTANTIRTETVESANTFKNIVLFLIAPFIGLAYAVLLPFVGIAMLLWTAGKALAESLQKTQTPVLAKIATRQQAT